MCIKILLENLKRSDYLKDLGIDGRIIINWRLMKQGWQVWIVFSWLRIRIVEGFYE